MAHNTVFCEDLQQSAQEPHVLVGDAAAAPEIVDGNDRAFLETCAECGERLPRVLRTDRFEPLLHRRMRVEPVGHAQRIDVAFDLAREHSE